MPINDTLETLKNQLSGSVKTVLPSQGIPSKRSGSAPSSLTAWTEITFYKEGGPRPGRTIGRGGSGGDTWVLPLPQDLSDVNSFEYEPIEFGGVTMALDSFYNAITLGQDKGNTTGASSKPFDMGVQAGGALVAAGTTTLDLIGSENAKNAVRAKYRQTANPNLEALFKSSNLRTFQFSWNITPLTEADSEQLSDFVSTFKKSIYPGSGSLLLTGNSAQLLFFPYEFVVSFYSQGIRGGSNLIFSTASCACTDFTVQYTPNGAFNTHIDGKPTALSMNATFQEMYILSSNDIEQLEKKY